QGAVWMILAAVASVALMTNPMWLPKGINNVVSQVSEAGMTAVTTTTSNGAGDICKVDEGGDVPDDLPVGKTSKYIPNENAQTRKIVRQMQCTMWYSFMYTPWVIGEFGDSPSEIDANHIAKKGFSEGAQKVGGQDPVGGTGIGLVKLGSAGRAAPDSAQSWALYHLDNKIAYPGISADKEQQQQNNLVSVALTQLHTESYNKVYKGDDSMNRIATSTIGFVAALGAGIMVVIVSMSIIVLDVGLIILTLVSPLFFLIGVHPGFGRRIALGWVETILGLAMKRIVLSMLLAVMLVFYAVILSANAAMPWLFSMILVIAVSIGGISYKDQILNMFNKISLGGDGGVQPQTLPGADKAKSAGRSVIKGAAQMALAGKMMGANNRGKTGGTGDGSGAGARKAPPTTRDRAAQEVMAENAAGAGAEPKNLDNKRKGETPNATAGLGGGAGTRKEPNAKGIDANSTKGVDSNNTKAVDLDKDAASGAGARIHAEEAEEATQIGGAGHYTGPDGRIVDANGVAVPMDRLSAEEREVMEGGAGYRIENNNDGAAIDSDMSPSAQAIARIKENSPKEIQRRADLEAKRITDRDRLLPPMKPTAVTHATAVKQNKAIAQEKKRLEAKSNGAPVTSTQALKSIQEKERLAHIARQKRNINKAKLVQKKRQLVDAPIKSVGTASAGAARELRSMAGAADKQYTKGYVKKTVVGTKNVSAKAGSAAISAVDRKIDNAASRALFHAQVEAKVWEIRSNNIKEKRQLNREQAHIPKKYRSTELPSRQERRVEQPSRQPTRRIEPPNS
ncbi:MAG: type IV secretion system protein, partial [Enterococcus sp.]|nr:type IV secretion system protein [Enterococcus sp.]